MNPLHHTLMGYRLELSQLRERKRSHENQAAEAGQKAALVEARIAGIQEAADLLGADIEPPMEVEKPKAKKRQRSLSGPWKDIMARADQHGQSFDYDDLEDFAEVIGHPVGRDTLRSQMSGYKSAGLVESVGGGRFSVTDLGRAAAEIEKPEQRETTREEQDEYDQRTTTSIRPVATYRVDPNTGELQFVNETPAA